MKKVLDKIDSVVRYTGEMDKFFALALVLVMTQEVIRRYFFNAASIYGYDTAVMIGLTIYILAWSYADLHNQHVRVDVLYLRQSPAVKAIIDICGAVFFFFPFVAMLLYVSYGWMIKAWVTHEVRSETYWYPPAAPIRTVFFLGVVLFTLRGLVRFIRDVYTLRGKPL